MDVKSASVTRDAALVMRLLDDGSAPQATRALKELVEEGEPVTATALAKAAVESSVPAVRPPQPPARESAAAQRVEFELRVEISESASASARIESGEAGTRVEVSASAERHVRIELRARRVEQQKSDPLIVDVDGDGVYRTTGAAGGAAFDVDGDGSAEQTSWVGPGDAFLAWDRDGNGRIDDGGELFGDQHGAADGISELTRYDENADGVIDASDAVWDRLVLWSDANRDGDSAGELVSLAGAGFRAIDLGRRAYEGSTTGGDTLDGAITMYRTDGSSVGAADAWLARA